MLIIGFSVHTQPNAHQSVVILLLTGFYFFSCAGSWLCGAVQQVDFFVCCQCVSIRDSVAIVTVGAVFFTIGAGGKGDCRARLGRRPGRAAGCAPALIPKRFSTQLAVSFLHFTPPKKPGRSQRGPAPAAGGLRAHFFPKNLSPPPWTAVSPPVAARSFYTWYPSPRSIRTCA